MKSNKVYHLRLLFIVFLFIGVCVQPAEKYIDYTFKLTKEDAKEVQIEGDFTGWIRIPMEKSGKVWLKTFKLKPNRLYEYRFIVDGTAEIDPTAKNTSSTNDTSILLLDAAGQPVKINKKEIDSKIIEETIKELLENQKKFLQELEFIRGELTKKDLQIELLKAQIDKTEADKREKQEALKTIKMQYDQLDKKIKDMEKETLKLQQMVESAKKDYKAMQTNYFKCLKSSEKLKKQARSLAKRIKKIQVTARKRQEIVNKEVPENIEEKDKKKEPQNTTAPTYTRIGKAYEVSASSNLVVIYIEENKNVATGDMLYVLQNNEVKATLTVTSVEGEWCYAKIVSGSKNDVKNKDIYIITSDNNKK